MNFVWNAMQGLLASLYRLSNGKVMGHMAGLNILLLTTTGRKSGRARTTPLGYFEDEGNYVIIASNGGADHHPAWFLNLKNNSHASIEIGNKKISVDAKEADPKKRETLWSKLISVAPMYAKYATTTKRVIPVVVLHPQGS